ncbi:hypothetical protein I6G82_22925 [Lysinibacillus macroides]|uniref:Uncharacterized protein n=1 Tax=Lysinibacillus macroides TaxID=33935 RepID=A0A0M9DJ08_9BACI|nr:hypothetical protein [Lysinibacillus macroides]KOY81879.1 hypothetical protein ADM90_13290 [Lysinibacillus macroides]QPR67988.1 hypothetical protein I6G82_22925 [Lysinibacillus macroides]
MVDGFYNAYSNLIEARLADIYKSEEYTVLTETIFHEFEQKLSAKIGELGTEERESLFEDFQTAIFNQTHHQNKLTYRIAFNDALSFFMDTILTQKR